MHEMVPSRLLQVVTALQVVATSKPGSITLWRVIPFSAMTRVSALRSTSVSLIIGCSRERAAANRATRPSWCRIVRPLISGLLALPVMASLM